MNIPELRLKVKDMVDRLNTREVYSVLLIIVVGFGSFGLGRISKLEEAHIPIRIEQVLSPQTASAAVASPLTRGETRIPGASQDLERPSSDAKGVQLRYGALPSAAGGVLSSVKNEGLKIKGSPATPSAGGQLIASKTGAKYHFPWCSGAQRISETNRVWFNSIEEARKAGYTPASNCKGLK